MKPSSSPTTWYRTPGIKFLACYIISVVCIHLWANHPSDVSGQPEPSGFQLLVRDTTAPGSPLELIELGSWRARCEACSGKVLELQPSEAVPPGDANGLHFVRSTVRPSGAGVEVTVAMHTEYYNLQSVYRVEGGRVFPLTRHNDVPLIFSLLISTVSGPMLLFVVVLLSWLFTRVARVIREK